MAEIRPFLVQISGDFDNGKSDDKSIESVLSLTVRKLKNFEKCN